MEKNNDSIPKFFCENCGKEVKRNATMCVHCGRFFASVKCPACNYTGLASRFSNGCPRCGYAVRKEGAKEVKEKKEVSSSQKTRYNSLPIWIYTIIFIFFLGVIFLFFFL